MKLGILSGYSGKVVNLEIEKIQMAESMGYDSVWTAEAYGSDAVTPATWILANTTKIRVGTAIMQMPARTPACTAMTAMTLAQLSGGRFILGLGASGPQVVEGWHGVAYGRPLTRTKEYIEIVRKIMAREGPVEHEGYHFNLPYKGDDADRARQRPGRAFCRRTTPFRSIRPRSHPKASKPARKSPTGSFRCG
ncbi:MAG: LLM class flavin-dependent oxidoreductase [Gammaproteobacteria bacterium]|nr:LLM class flavin-dependent oxidoreductase [Gammaproteobacteria bacterium]